MQIGEVIRANRRRLGLTQEQVADRLGVTAPAVNKWEKGAALPDITLLAPIARLLDVSLEELLSFREELTEEEVRSLIRQGDERLSKGPYDEAYAWVRQTLAQWPNCEKLTLHLIQMLDSWARMQGLPVDGERDKYIMDGYTRLLDSRDEDIRRSAAESLVGLHMWREEYEGAEAFLKYFSKYDPLGKLLRGQVLEKTAQPEALKTYEELLFSGGNMLNMVLQFMQVMALRADDTPRARMLAEKQCALAKVLEMGDYAAASPLLEVCIREKDADGLISLVERLLASVGTLGAFTASPLYEHMTLKSVEPDFAPMVRKSLVQDFREGEEYAFVGDDPRWRAMLEKYE